MTKNKITFEDITKKEKEIIWNSKKNDDETYEIDIVFDKDKEIKFLKVPGQYVKEDGDFEKKELDEKESKELLNRRIESLLRQIQQAIFTVNFYGGKINGYISSGKKDK